MDSTLKQLYQLRQLTVNQTQAILWLYKKKLLLFTGIGALLGVACAFLVPISYRVEASIMPEIQTRSALSFKRFGALAELAGIDLDAASGITEAVRPDLYPNILSSKPFQVYILNQPVETSVQQKYPTLVAFLTDPNRYWYSKLLDNNPISLTAPADSQLFAPDLDQEDLLKSLSEQIRSDLDKQTGLILIRVDLPDAQVAARVSQLSIDYIRKYVTTYRTEKLRQNLNFLTRQRQDAHRRYTIAKEKLARYQDEHRYTVLQSASLVLQELEGNVAIARTVFDDITREFEQTRIRIQEETPILKTLEPPYVPARRHSPRRTWYALGFMAVGLLVGAVWVLVNHHTAYKS